MVPVREFLPMFSVLWCHGVRSFMVSCLIFMSLSPFEFIFVYGARVGSHFICVHATIQLCERYFCHIREIQNGPPLWVGKSPKNSQKHSMTEWDSNTWVCFVTVFFFFLAMPWGKQDLNSMTRDQTCTPYTDSVELSPLGCQGSPYVLLLKGTRTLSIT